MIVACHSCGSKYKYDEKKLVGVISKKLKCPKCKSIIVAVHPDSKKQVPEFDASSAMEQTYPNAASSGNNSKSGDAPTTARRHRDEVMAGVRAMEAVQENPYLSLPEDRRYSLAVIQGYDVGEIHHITKAQVVMGRADSDILIKDLEASRQHARLDVLGDNVILRDLDSTNGTYVNDEKILTSTLENHSEFRIGTTVYMLIITDLE